jgi:hypothetical protein
MYALWFEATKKYYMLNEKNPMMWAIREDAEAVAKSINQASVITCEVVKVL